MALSLSIFLISAATIGYEIVLMRLFSIILWSHFAYMIISVAMLGFGASGVYLAMAGKRTGDFTTEYSINAALFGLFSVGGFALAQWVRFNPLEILWDWGQTARLFAVYLSLFPPFFFSANCVGMALIRSPARDISKLYFSNLLGAGFGAAAAIALLFTFRGEACLLIVGAAGFVAAGAALLQNGAGKSKPAALSLVILSVLTTLLWPSGWVEPKISEYKGLAASLRLPESKVLTEKSSPLGLLTVVESLKIPFRHAPGLSLANQQEPAAQLAIFTDGGAMDVITKNEGREGEHKYLEYLTWAVPYRIVESPKVLILGAGGGTDTLMALEAGASNIDAVEANPQTAQLAAETFANYSGNIYGDKRVKLHIAGVRGFVESSNDKYDLIMTPPPGSPASSGGGAVSAGYLYTVEAISAYLERLAPGGILAVTRWAQIPPRETLKIFGAAVSALERAGSDDPGESLALIRGWRTATLLVKNGRFTPAQIAQLKDFLREKSFDAVWLPGLERGEANIYNKLTSPYFYDAATALLKPDRDEYIENYQFNIEPATDDKPWFSHFFKWGVLPELWAKGNRGGFALIEHGYLVLAATLVQAAALFLALAAPVWFIVRRRAGPVMNSWWTGLYFASLGFGFMFIEIAYIHKFSLFLGDPIYSAATILSSFLIFAGFGSRVSGRLRNDVVILWAGIGVCAVLLVYMAVLPGSLKALTGLPVGLKAIVTAGLISPLAFAMGMLFPAGLAIVSERDKELLPWAWGVNGGASVLGAVLASVISIHFGITAVTALAAGLYALAAGAMRKA